MRGQRPRGALRTVAATRSCSARRARRAAARSRARAPRRPAVPARPRDRRGRGTAPRWSAGRAGPRSRCRRTPGDLGEAVPLVGGDLLLPVALDTAGGLEAFGQVDELGAVGLQARADLLARRAQPVGLRGGRPDGGAQLPELLGDGVHARVGVVEPVQGRLDALGRRGPLGLRLLQRELRPLRAVLGGRQGVGGLVDGGLHLQQARRGRRPARGDVRPHDVAVPRDRDEVGLGTRRRAGRRPAGPRRRRRGPGAGPGRAAGPRAR